MGYTFPTPPSSERTSEQTSSSLGRFQTNMFPNTLRVGIWTPKTLPQRPNLSRYLEDYRVTYLYIKTIHFRTCKNIPIPWDWHSYLHEWLKNLWVVCFPKLCSSLPRSSGHIPAFRLHPTSPRSLRTFRGFIPSGKPI